MTNDMFTRAEYLRRPTTSGRARRIGRESA